MVETGITSSSELYKKGDSTVIDFPLSNITSNGLKKFKQLKYVWKILTNQFMTLRKVSWFR